MYTAKYKKNKSYFEKCLINSDEIDKDGRMIYTDMEHTEKNKFNQ